MSISRAANDGTFEIHCFIFSLGLGVWFLNLEVLCSNTSSS
ncbi:hypothetical protein V6Z11_D01G105000 [Gossypium hirsutum]